MLKEMTFAEVADKLWANKDLPCYSFDFYCNYNRETEEKEWAYKAAVVRFADAQMVLINYYGGGAGFVYDIDEDGDSSGLACCLQNYFIHQGLEESVWVEEPDAIWLPSSVELGASVMAGPKQEDGAMHWRLRSVEISRKEERVVVVVEGGAVTDAFTTDRNISVEVIDKDVQTPEDEEALTETLEDLEAEIREGILHPAYRR